MKYLLILLFPMSLLAASGDHLSSVEVFRTKAQKPHVKDFCKRHAIECDRSGANSIVATEDIMALINEVNRSVNEEIEFVLDPDQYYEEEFWNIPSSGKGDCEDNALEKRRRLAELGVSRGAMSMATAFHKEKLYAHGLLLIETDLGTLVLDQDNSEVLLWHETVYGFESRELPSGDWEYFFQDWLL